jgi:phosphomannomutase
MKINPSIFKSYDIRGIYPAEINGEVAYSIGRAIVKFLKKSAPRLVVSRDNRLSSPEIHQGLVAGLTDSGADITDLGLATTPMLYWTSAFYAFDGGISITASHNPPNYNGLKIIKGQSLPVGADSGLEEIRDLILKDKLGPIKKGKIEKKDILAEYINFNLKGFKKKDVSPVKIVFDFANAVPSILLPKLKENIKGKIYPLFSELDGNFPNHLANPLLPENLISLQKEVKKKKADLGVAFDGDGDRIIFVDEKGEMVSPGLIIALMARPILEKNAGAKILYDLRCSNIIHETVEKLGGIPLINRVGHTFIKDRMRREDIIFGGESAGHYYHKDHFFWEAPLFVLFTLLREMSVQNKSLSQLISPFKVYYHSGELNFSVQNKEQVLKEIEKKYSDGKISKMDGLRIDFKDWWFNIRGSNTEPLLRLAVEAKTEKMLKEKIKSLSEIIKRN